MLSIDYAWMLALLPAPLLLRRWLTPVERGETALAVPLLPGGACGFSGRCCCSPRAGPTGSTNRSHGPPAAAT